jgi:5-formyltetrahydrofolate cyclo-ligase
MGKAELRAAALARRAAMSLGERAAASRVAAERACALIGAAPGVVAVFMSIGEEIDTAPLIERLAAFPLALPVVAGRGRPLTFRRWAPGDRLEPRVWGIREPLASAPSVEPDTLIVPLAAFDRAGGRIGYGAGHYDRSLAALRAAKDVQAVGYAFACQETDAVPVEPHDEPLDAVVTERETVAFRRPAR